MADVYDCENIQDPANFIGFQNVLNKDEIDTDIDFDQACEDLPHQSVSISLDVDKEMNTFLKDLEKESGVSITQDNLNNPINLNDFDDVDNTSVPQHKNNTFTKSIDELSGLPRDLNLGGYAKNVNKQEPENTNSNNYGSNNYNSNNYGSNNYNDHNSSGIFTSNERKNMEINKIINGNSYQSELNFDFEKERQNEIKSDMFDDIQQLLSELSELNIDTSRVPQVTMSNSYEEIKATRRMLKSKYNANRYHDLGRDVLLVGMRALEMVFDGRRSFFGKRPNLTGWADASYRKLTKMKYETSTIVRNIFDKWELGPFTQLLVELLPSAFVYVATNSSNAEEEEEAITDAEYNESMRNLYDI